MKRIKSIVTKAKVVIAFLTHLHFVITRDVKNVRKIECVVEMCLEMSKKNVF